MFFHWRWREFERIRKLKSRHLKSRFQSDFIRAIFGLDPDEIAVRNEFRGAKDDRQFFRASGSHFEFLSAIGRGKVAAGWRSELYLKTNLR